MAAPHHHHFLSVVAAWTTHKGTKRKLATHKMSQEDDKNDSNKQETNAKTSEEVLYLASVYRYTCLGHVRASANEKDDRVCRGIQYGLQYAAESHSNISRQAATDDFALLNDTSKDRRHHGLPPSINDALRTQAVILGEQERTDKEWNDIDSYGITDVEVLILQDANTKKSQVTSIASHCFVGNSIRDIGTKEGKMVSATLHLGPVEITLDSGVEEHEQKSKALPANKTNSPARHDSTRSRLDALQLSKKVADNMVKGASMLRDAVSEDFPSRMYDASGRVVGQMGKTVERTGKVAKSMYRVWFGADDDDAE